MCSGKVFLMIAPYNMRHINLGPPSYSGHEAYLKACYISPDNLEQPLRIIYKKNKFGVSLFSRFEASFSQVAQLFLSPHLTPKQHLVVNDEQDIMGVATEHMCYAIEKKEGAERLFYNFSNPKVNCDITEITDSEEKIYFFDKLPQGFFAKLIDAEKKGQLKIDYESLASILATSYTLEEDDLHKGNFGFYMVEKEGQAHIVFFKIDHDLMCVDSIMGFQAFRPFHLFDGSQAFNITVEDLLSFPNLKHSANGYWPTKFTYIAHPFSDKEYHSFAENKAFSHLAKNPAFIKAKWRAFYKHSLVSLEIIQYELENSSDMSMASDRAHIALITQSMAGRLAHLRAALLSIPEFRDYVTVLTDKEKADLVAEIAPKPHFLEPIKQMMATFEDYAKNSFEQDTPLHTIIKLGEYRYEETERAFGHFINIENAEGKTPLDTALELFESPFNNSKSIRHDMLGVMRHLIEKGAKKSEKFKAHPNIERQLAGYVVHNIYLEQINSELPYTDFKSLLRDLGEDHQFCLKYKKNLALECIKKWLDVRQNHLDFKKELMQLKKEVNGYATEEESAGLKYLRQLRSKLWIVRQIRGLYGNSSTLTEINNLITQKEELLAPKQAHKFSFFSCCQQTRDFICLPNSYVPSL